MTPSSPIPPVHRASEVGHKVWFIEWGGSANLTVREIWPDGDAPENPTDEDVMNVMRKSGSIDRLCMDWNLDLQGVEVNGKNVDGLR